MTDRILIADDPYTQWRDGDLTPLATLRALCLELGEVESELAPLHAQRDALRAQIADVLGKVDNQKATIAGFGTVSNMGGSLVERFNKAALNALVNDLLDEGNEALAVRIRACSAKSWRAGGLRVERER